MIDICMTLWNLCLKGKVTKVLIALLLICMSMCIVLVAVGLPAFSQRAVPARGRSMVVAHQAGRMAISRAQISKHTQHNRVPTVTVATNHPFPCVPMPSEKTTQPVATTQASAMTGAQALLYPSRAAPAAILPSGSKSTRGRGIPVTRSAGRPFPDPTLTVPVHALPMAHPTAVVVPTVVVQPTSTPVSAVLVTPTATLLATPVANTVSAADATPTALVLTPQTVTGPINEAQDSSMAASAPVVIFVAISLVVHVAQMAFEQWHSSWPDGCLSDSFSQALPGDHIVTLGPILTVISGTALACVVFCCCGIYAIRRRRF